MGTVMVQLGYNEGTVGYNEGTVRVQWGTICNGLNLSF